MDRSVHCSCRVPGGVSVIGKKDVTTSKVTSLPVWSSNIELAIEHDDELAARDWVELLVQLCG